MNKYKWLVVVTLVLLGMTACVQQPVRVQRVGGDRDVDGCIGSAGYLWCAREVACVRPWELSAQKQLGQGMEAFKQYCAGH